MKDQVDSLTQLGISAARLDSSLDAAGTRKVYEDLHAGRLKLLYVAPERLSSERFLHAIAGRVVSMLAIDEAHCISEWGHNFRPIYLKLASLADRLPIGGVLALTVTATPEVARDIADAFHIDEAHILRDGLPPPQSGAARDELPGRRTAGLAHGSAQDPPAGGDDRLRHQAEIG
jgi:ATP-dependent DNA helicase RecQ